MNNELSAPFICKGCNKPIIGTIYTHYPTSGSGDYYCKDCTGPAVCKYCDPPLLERDCPGHSISRNTENRFMANKEFVAGSRFEMD